MGIEAIGSIGSAMGSVASGIGKAGGRVAPAVAGLEARFGPVMGPVDIGSIVNEGPVGFADMKNTMPLHIGQINPITEINFQPQPILNTADVVAEAESILAQVRIPEPKEVFPKEVVWPQVEPMVLPRVEPFVIPNELKDPLPQIAFSPALAPAIGMQRKTESKNVTQPAQAVAIQPALQKQEEVEEIVEEKVQKEQEEVLEEEETEVFELKDVVDEEVLNIRLEEFSSAADLAGAEAKEEIDGKKIVERIPAETEANRSGLIKKRGPDGSREETIGEIASRKFRSIREAKEKIAAIIAQKVPVKRAKEGMAVGHEAVARVFKYFFVRAKPVEQLVTRVAKKQRPLQIVSVAKPEIKESRIEDLGLAEIFPKAA